jgi:hypothetical protein
VVIVIFLVAFEVGRLLPRIRAPAFPSVGNALNLGALMSPPFHPCLPVRAGSPYRAGPSKTWLKVKNRAHPSVARVKDANSRR